MLWGFLRRVLVDFGIHQRPFKETSLTASILPRRSGRSPPTKYASMSAYTRIYIYIYIYIYKYMYMCMCMYMEVYMYMYVYVYVYHDDSLFFVFVLMLGHRLARYSTATHSCGLLPPIATKIHFEVEGCQISIHRRLTCSYWTRPARRCLHQSSHYPHHVFSLPACTQCWIDVRPNLSDMH